MELNLKPYEKNAKIHPEKQLKALAEAVKEFGWRSHVEVNSKGVILHGHGRFLAWQKFKDELKLPDVWILDDTGKTIFGAHADWPLTAAQQKAYRLADNRLNESKFHIPFALKEFAQLDEHFQLINRLEKLDFSKDLSTVNKEIEFSNLKTQNECPKCGFTF